MLIKAKYLLFKVKEVLLNKFVDSYFNTDPWFEKLIVIVEPEKQNNQIDPASMFRKGFRTINSLKEARWFEIIQFICSEECW